MPVTTALEHQDVVSFDNSHNVIVALEPVFSTRMDPADVMATVG